MKVIIHNCLTLVTVEAFLLSFCKYDSTNCCHFFYLKFTKKTYASLGKNSKLSILEILYMKELVNSFFWIFLHISAQVQSFISSSAFQRYVLWLRFFGVVISYLENNSNITVIYFILVKTIEILCLVECSSKVWNKYVHKLLKKWTDVALK